jgi:choline-sulfatase
VFCHTERLRNRPARLKLVLSDSASLSVPMIMSGPQVPGGAICDTPVSLCDVAPTVTSCMGLSSNNISRFVGENLLNLANQPKRDRIQFAEYHAVGAETGQFMVRRGKWKYVHFVGADNQLFDIENDTNETQDLGKMYQFSEVVKSLHSELLKHCDPIEVNRRAFDDQARKISAHGGKYVIESHTDIPFTPPP